MLNPEQMAIYEDAMRRAGLENEQQKLNMMQMQMAEQMKDPSMIKEQLDLSQEKQEIYYQLRGFTLSEQEDGSLEWKRDPNNDLSFLTDAGINYCFWFLTGYLGKHILLGNYEDETIREKMEDIGTVIADTLFNKSNRYFKEPTLEEMKKELRERIQKKVDLRKFANELLNRTSKDEDLEREIILEMEDRIEVEMENIKRSLMNERHRMLNSLVIWMLDQIHGAYQRAWKGQERRSIREHMYVTETKGGVYMPEKKETFLDKFRKR